MLTSKFRLKQSLLKMRMKTQLHAIASIPITLILGLYSTKLAIWFYLASVLIDGDHVVSYRLSYGDVDFNFKKICNAFTSFDVDAGKKIKYVLPLHSYELVLALSVVSIVFDHQTRLLGIIFGLAFHLFVDFVTLRPKLFGGKTTATLILFFNLQIPPKI